MLLFVLSIFQHFFLKAIQQLGVTSVTQQAAEAAPVFWGLVTQGKTERPEPSSGALPHGLHFHFSSVCPQILQQGGTFDSLPCHTSAGGFYTFCVAQHVLMAVLLLKKKINK